MSKAPDIHKILEAARQGKTRRFEIGQGVDGQHYIKKAEIGADLEAAQSELDRIAAARKWMDSAMPASQNHQADIAPSKLLSEAIDWFYKKNERNFSNPSTLKKYGKHQIELLAVIGDCEVNTIHKYHLDQLRQHLQFEKNNTLPTIRNKFSGISLLFDDLIESGLYTKDNPAKGQIKYKLKQKKARSKTHGWQKFADQEISLIFNPATYRFKSPSEFFAPLILLYTGARMNEIAQLYISDIFQEQNQYCIKITDEKEDTTLKNDNSIRTIPLHPNILKSGFLEYLELLEKSGHARLFPHLTKAENRYGGRVTKAFLRYLGKLEIKPETGRNGAHRFRSTLIQKLQDHKIGYEIRKDFVGHSGETGIDFNDSHTISYARLSKISELAEYVLPALDFDIDIQGIASNCDNQQFLQYIKKKLST